MREEDLIYSLSELNEEFVKEANPEALSEQKATGGKHKMPRIALAAIAFVCLLTLSGGIVWAMNSGAMKDYFFSKSGEKFSDLYSEIEREYFLDNYKVIYEGSIYEELVEQAYLEFSIWDKDGNPVDIEQENINTGVKGVHLPNPMLTEKLLRAYSIKIGQNVFYLVCTYINGILDGSCEDNHLYMKLSIKSEDGSYKEKEVSLLILSEEQWKSFYDDIGALDQNELCKITYDKETDSIISNWDKESLLPEVVDVINKYEPCVVEMVSYPTQIINIGNAEITICRTGMLIKYNINDCELNDFILRRADGTEFHILYDRPLYKFDWDIEDHRVGVSGECSGDDKTGEFSFKCNFNFILDANEKVTIEADGNIYE